MICDEHYTYVACKPGEPGAYAACTADPRYKRYAMNFKRRETRAGAKVLRVTCNEAQALLNSWKPREPQGGEVK